MLYTIAFDTSGAAIQRASYQPAAAAPSPLPDGELECTAEQYEAWTDYVLSGDEIVLLDEPTRQQKAKEALTAGLCAAERVWRDGVLSDKVGMRDRHRDEVDLGIATTLTSEQFGELLGYIQQLREWPQAASFPDALKRPVPPAWLAALQTN